jgi:transcriptional regulator with XRE-family HTH domain
MKNKVGRPKGRSLDKRSFGPLGDLTRTHRLAKGMGLLEVAKACGCSVQFISNIEHGRAPLPWDKVASMATALKIPAQDLQAANLAIRSDFNGFMALTRDSKKTKSSVILRKVTGSASAVAFAAKDTGLREVIEKYQAAPSSARKKFVQTALQLLQH